MIFKNSQPSANEFSLVYFFIRFISYSSTVSNFENARGDWRARICAFPLSPIHADRQICKFWKNFKIHVIKLTNLDHKQDTSIIKYVLILYSFFKLTFLFIDEQKWHYPTC